MKSRMHVLALVVGAVVSTLTLTAGIASAQPPQDFVTGAGNHAGGVQFTVSAHRGPAGQGAMGTFSFKIAGQERVRAEVTCLIVVGNQAIVTGTYTDPQTGTAQIVVMHVVDNGEPGTSATPDLLRFSFANGGIVPDPQHPGCFLPVLPPVPVTQGNIVVHDAQP